MNLKRVADEDGQAAGPRSPGRSADGRGASRRRGAELENAILDAAWEVLVERGYPDFTFEAVATRAGTSRPVLYRRWPHRENLLLATIDRFWRAHPIAVPDTGRLRDDAIGFLHNADTGLHLMISLINVQITEYFRDSGTNFAELRDMSRGSALPFQTIVDRAVARGELPDVPRSTRLVNLAFDLYRHDGIMTMRPLTDEAIREIVDDVWIPLLKLPRPGLH